MSPALKFLIGLAAVAGMTWLHHGPLGNGAALVDRLESNTRQAVAASELPGIDVRLGRDPLSRFATLSGTANSFQREGQGNLKGINDYVTEVEGISGSRWTDEPEETVIPLLAETLILTFAAYLLGLGLAWLLWGRPKREGFY
ncbi:MAG TPA: hypothetical protein VNT77_02180 [Allosphingosinicella sp.]|nr:hypothetical protein [Allosphingosinicella sp.]